MKRARRSVAGDLGLGHGASDHVRRAVPRQLLQHLLLALMVFADGEGHELVQRQFLSPIEVHQLGADGA